MDGQTYFSRQNFVYVCVLVGWLLIMKSGSCSHTREASMWSKPFFFFSLILALEPIKKSFASCNKMNGEFLLIHVLHRLWLYLEFFAKYVKSWEQLTNCEAGHTWFELQPIPVNHPKFDLWVAMLISLDCKRQPKCPMSYFSALIACRRTDTPKNTLPLCKWGLKVQLVCFTQERWQLSVSLTTPSHVLV